MAINIEVSVKVNGREVKIPEMDKVIEWWVTQKLSQNSKEKEYVKVKDNKEKTAKVVPWTEEEVAQYKTYLLNGIEKGQTMAKIIKSYERYNGRSYGAMYVKARHLIK